MDAAHQGGGGGEDEPSPDRYLIQIWQAEPDLDRVVKATSAQAAYWHSWASELPSREDYMEHQARILAHEQREKAIETERRRVRAEADRLATETAFWGGRLPSEPVRRLSGNALSVARRDPNLADAIAAASPHAQREMARWLVRRTYEEAGLLRLPWAAAAVTAVERGEPLPPPFDDHTALFNRLFDDPDVPSTTVPMVDRPEHQTLQQAMALPAVDAARGSADPLHAALEVLATAVVTFGHGRITDLFAEVRARLAAILPE